MHICGRQIHIQYIMLYFMLTAYCILAVYWFSRILIKQKEEEEEEEDYIKSKELWTGLLYGQRRIFTLKPSTKSMI